MPSRSKKKKANKRKKETANHQTPPNSSPPQGNGLREEHHSSDEDFSLRSSMEAQSEPEAEESGDASVVLIESERTEVAAAAPLEGLEELSATVEVKEKSGEGRSCSEGAEIPVSVPRDVSAAGAYPLLERRTSWWNCCGLLDVFGGSRS